MFRYRDERDWRTAVSPRKISAFDLSTFEPSRQDIARSRNKMPPAPARTLSSGMRIVQKSPRGTKHSDLQCPATMPNMSLEEQPSVSSESIEDMLRLEREMRHGARLRDKDLSKLRPAKEKQHKRGLRPTRQGGGPVLQPGGGFRGN
jgi:hypothetical protein